MATKRKKPHDPRRWVQANNERILKGFAVGYVASGTTKHNPISLIDLKGNELPITKTMNDALSLFRYKWSIYLSVLGVDSEGKRYSKSEVVTCKVPTLQSDLVKYLNDRHQALIKGFNPNHICSAAWIAQPTGKDFTEKEAFDIFVRLGTFEHVN